MKKTAIILMIITILSKLFGFARDIILSFFYGTSNISDAYLISQTIPVVIFGFIGAGIMSAYIPMLARLDNEFGEDRKNEFTNNIVNLLIFVSTIFLIIGFLFTEEIVKVIASGFEDETFNIAVQFTRISLIGIYFTGLVSVLKGYLQSRNSFVVTALIGFPMNVIFIFSIILSSKTSIYVLAIGGVLGIASQLLLLLPFVYKYGFRYKFTMSIRDKHLNKMALLALPVMIGVSVNEINTLVDRTLASQIEIGGISALNYATRFNSFVLGIFVLPIATVMYPLISKMSTKKDFKGLRMTVSESINSVILLILPITLGIMTFSVQIIDLLYGRGAFDESAVTLTSNALFFYSIGLIGFGLREVLARVFYSLEDTKTPMINATLAMIINVLLNIVLSKYMGIGGLALATSVAAITCSILLFMSLIKKIGSIGMKSTTTSFIKIFVASFFMCILSKIVYMFLINSLNNGLSLILSIFVGAFTYLIIVYFLKVKEIEVILLAVNRRIKGNKQ